MLLLILIYSALSLIKLSFINLVLYSTKSIDLIQNSFLFDKIDEFNNKFLNLFLTTLFCITIKKKHFRTILNALIRKSHFLLFNFDESSAKEY
jgi:hypothetical protein